MSSSFKLMKYRLSRIIYIEHDFLNQLESLYIPINSYNQSSSHAKGGHSYLSIKSQSERQINLLSFMSDPKSITASSPEAYNDFVMILYLSREEVFLTRIFDIAMVQCLCV